MSELDWIALAWWAAVVCWLWAIRDMARVGDEHDSDNPQAPK